jgi:hypothetical protein
MSRVQSLFWSASGTISTAAEEHIFEESKWDPMCSLTTTPDGRKISFIH